MDTKALFNLSYGLYIVSAKNEERFNGQIANTVFQVSGAPNSVAVSINKQNLTHEFIQASRLLTVSILAQSAPLSLIGHFGFKSGREADKFAGANFNYKIGENGLPYVTDHTNAFIEAKVIREMDANTHTVFLAEVTGAAVLSSEPSMTYAYYHQIKRGAVPKTAPLPEVEKPVAAKVVKDATYRCTICGYIYDPEIGDPENGVPPALLLKNCRKIGPVLFAEQPKTFLKRRIKINMQPMEIKPAVHWVGAIDWDLRDFHGYLTPRGTTYNAYLIIDEKIALVDTVKQTHFEEMLTRLKQLVNPDQIDYIIANHVEMDHSGSLPLLLEIAPQAKVITSPQGEKGLRRYFKKNWPFQAVKSSETLKLGRRNLQFFHTPMVHWPDSMVTYLAEEKLLLSNDAFGQHIATSRRFDSEVGWDILYEEAATYYANIVLLYGENVKKALAALGNLDIEMIAPSHGIIWQKHRPEILKAYQKWANHQTEPKTVIVYDTMWGSTKKIAFALQAGLTEAGIPVSMRCLKTNHISAVMPDVLEAKAILIGSPTLNNGLLPSISAFLTYLKGLRPKERIGFVFGSYGWGGQAVKEIEEVVNFLGWSQPLESINIQYLPDPEELAQIKVTGKKLGEIIQKEA